MTTKRPAQEVEKLGPVGNTAQAQKWACTRTRTIARFHLLIFFFFLDVQKSCKNHTLTLKCLIPHLNRLVFIWRQWTDHLWTYKTMDHKSGTKSDNKMQKTQIEKDDDAEKNTLTTYNHKTYPLKICEGLVSSPGDYLKMFQTHAFVY